jgi:hypothetical protein
MSVSCSVCGASFKNDKGLHMHISKIHKITLAEYYVNLYAKKDLHSGELLPFINKQQYLNSSFLNYSNFFEWSKYADKKDVKNYLLQQLRYRVDSKNLKYAPNHIELNLNELPGIDLYKQFFGSYSSACEELKIMPLFNKNIMADFFEENLFFNKLKILIDTREQKPLDFSEKMFMKLDFGDYTIGSPHYNYTYVDRKSESDFKGTFSTGVKRFKRELERAKEFSSYIFVVTESSIKDIIKNNSTSVHRSNLSYIWHNIREISHEYENTCQFVFSGSRANSEFLIPRLLYYGKKIWKTDMQYFIDKHDLGNG